MAILKLEKVPEDNLCEVFVDFELARMRTSIFRKHCYTEAMNFSFVLLFSSVVAFAQNATTPKSDPMSDLMKTSAAQMESNMRREILKGEKIHTLLEASISAKTLRDECKKGNYNAAAFDNLSAFIDKKFSEEQARIIEINRKLGWPDSPPGGSAHAN